MDPCPASFEERILFHNGRSLARGNGAADARDCMPTILAAQIVASGRSG
jgi:hypothetical protein